MDRRLTAKLTVELTRTEAQDLFLLMHDPFIQRGVTDPLRRKLSDAARVVVHELDPHNRPATHSHEHDDDPGDCVGTAVHP